MQTEQFAAGFARLVDLASERRTAIMCAGRAVALSSLAHRGRSPCAASASSRS
jgi:hypothetical protein